MSKTQPQNCGYVAIIGRPNVGKSTLLNHILQYKLSITSRKPQTTQHRILGVKTVADTQAIYLDTPGLHKNKKKMINRYMNRAALNVIFDVDVIVFVVDQYHWTIEDQLVLDYLTKAKSPVILAVNKIDRIKEKTAVLSCLQHHAARYQFTEVVPISARNGHNIEKIEQLVSKLLPAGIHLFPKDQMTDVSEKFIVRELIREKIVRQLGDELPYQITVTLEKYVQEKILLTISALIYVETEGQKAIVIGKQGARLKKIGSAARIDIENQLQIKVMLSVWVKVKRNWSDDSSALRQLGYDDLQ